MSGIFKAVKKTIKKVGKVIKKLAPALLIAAAVYFGGAYLMSSGAASAGAAGSVGTSFTKAAGVWKSFISGMANGTASQSAAAFAEASWQASQGANPLSLSGQVAAGTSAVNALSNMGSTAEAVSAGVDYARNVWAQSNTPQGRWDILLNGLEKTQTLITDAAKANVTPADALTRVKRDLWGGATADSNYRSYSDGWGGAGDDGIILQDSAADIPRKVAAQYGMDRNMLADAGETKVLDQSGGPILKSNVAGGTVASRDTTFAQTMAKQSQDFIALWKTTLDDSREYNKQLLADRNRIATQQMWMQGTGLLLSAIGASEDTDAEKKHKRTMSWKPSGEERYAAGLSGSAGKIYPLTRGGIIT